MNHLNWKVEPEAQTIGVNHEVAILAEFRAHADRAGIDAIGGELMPQPHPAGCNAGETRNLTASQRLVERLGGWLVGGSELADAEEGFGVQGNRARNRSYAVGGRDTTSPPSWLS